MTDFKPVQLVHQLFLAIAAWCGMTVMAKSESTTPTAANQQKNLCVVRLDRIQFVVQRPRRGPLPAISDYRVLRDTLVHSQTSIPTYARCRQLVSTATGAKLFIQYQRRRSWLAGWKLTAIAATGRGLTPNDLRPILARCRGHRLLLVELAFDFSPESGVNLPFVRRHGMFGRSRRRLDRGGPGQLRFGSRRSAKLVRCYDKRPEMNVLRVELEAHSGLLRANCVTTADDLVKLTEAVVPRHLQFRRVAWGRLRRHLFRRFGKASGLHVFRATLDRAYSLHRACRYLRQQGVNNVHRFLRPMSSFNRQLHEALERWKASATGKRKSDNSKGAPHHATED